jgi:O-antigen/teichoic acid export membrane protein
MTEVIPPATPSPRAPVTDSESAAESAEHVASIGRKAGRGLRWSMFGTVVTKLGTFAVGLVLARLLAPADFGVYAIALAAMAFVMHVNDVGIIAAAVQWRGKLNEMAPTATVMAIGFSVAVYAGMWLLAPAFTELSGTPEATPVVRLLTAVILIDGVTAIRSAALMRRFQHDRLIKANLVGLAVNMPIAILLAADGAGAYSFVVGQVAGAAVTGILVFRWAEVPVRFGLDRAVARKLMKFGIPLAAGLGVESILLNADYVIIGGALGPAAVGFYLLAFNVSSWVPSVVGTAVRYVSIASYSRLAEHESNSLSTGVQRSVPLLIAAVLPIGLVMAILGLPLIAFLYGARWSPSAPVLTFLAVLMMVRLLTWLAVDILISMGNTRATVLLNVVWAVALVPALYLAVRLDGIEGAAIAHAAVGGLVALPLAGYILHRAGVRLGPIAPQLLRPLLAACVAGAVMVLLSWLVPAGGLAELSFAGGIGTCVYALIAVPREHLVRFLSRARARVSRSG